MKPFMVRRVLGIAVALLMPPLALTPLAAQQQAGTIVGFVRSATNDSVLPRALVSIEGRPVNIQADAEGRFRIEDVPAGKTRISARLLGYAPTKETVVVPAGGERVVELRLRPAAVQLAELTVIGTEADLEERRARLAQVPGSVALIESERDPPHPPGEPQGRARLHARASTCSRGSARPTRARSRSAAPGCATTSTLRGINLLVNGMPYRNADGFTDFESLELLNTESIEVYKGGNALRYGGSTLGGAINLETKTGYTAAPVGVVGRRRQLRLPQGPGCRRARRSASSTTTGATPAPRSTATATTRRRDATGSTAISATSSRSNTDIRAFYFFARVDEQLPGALTAAELASTPSAANPANRADRWGRDYDLHHLGLQLRTQLGANQRLEISPYFQYRDIDHPIFQVINQQSRDYGAEVRYENTLPLFGRSNRFTLGVQPAWLNMDNRQFDNEAASTATCARTRRTRPLGWRSTPRTRWR